MLLTQGAEQEQQGRVQHGSDPSSSSGIFGTQPSGSGNLPHTAPAAPPPAADPLAALRQAWQQQSSASPLLALFGTPGALSAPAWAVQQGLATPAAAAGGAGSPWPPPASWQPAPVAGAAKGATPRFVFPTGGSFSPAAAAAAAATPGCSPFLSLLGVPSLLAGAAACGNSGGNGTPDIRGSSPWGVRVPEQQQPQQPQQQHHRLARSGSPPQLLQPPSAAGRGPDGQPFPGSRDAH